MRQKADNVSGHLMGIITGIALNYWPDIDWLTVKLLEVAPGLVRYETILPREIVEFVSVDDWATVPVGKLGYAVKSNMILFQRRIEVADQIRPALETLIDECYGVLGWLNGTVSLSDGARKFKAQKLREAMSKVERGIRVGRG